MMHCVVLDNCGNRLHLLTMIRNRKNCPSNHDTFRRLAADPEEGSSQGASEGEGKTYTTTTKATKLNKLPKYATINYGIQIDSYSGETQELQILFP